MDSNKVRLKLSPAAAACIRKDASPEDKVKAAKGELPLPPGEFIVTLILLMNDENREIRSTALATLKAVSDDVITEVAESPDTHPKVLDVLARLHFRKQHICHLLTVNPNLEQETLAFLASKVELPQASNDRVNFVQPLEDLDYQTSEEIVKDEWCPTEQEEEAFKSKFQLAQIISISEKIKFAISGDKEWRSIMLKDSNKLVSGAVLKNPRITDQEILSIAKSTSINEENVRIISNNKDWIKNYQIRKALVENNKTPLPLALRFLATLSEKDTALIAKSKNVSTVIAAQARKAVIALQKRR